MSLLAHQGANMSKLNEQIRTTVISEIAEYVRCNMIYNECTLISNSDVPFIVYLTEMMSNTNIAEYIPISPDDTNQLHMEVKRDGSLVVSQSINLSILSHDDTIRAVLNGLSMTRNELRDSRLMATLLVELGEAIYFADNPNETSFPHVNKQQAVFNRICIIAKGRPGTPMIVGGGGDSLIVDHLFEDSLRVKVIADGEFNNVTVICSKINADGLVRHQVARVNNSRLDREATLGRVYSAIFKSLGNTDALVQVQTTMDVNLAESSHRKQITNRNINIPLLDAVLDEVTGDYPTVSYLVLERSISISLPFHEHELVFTCNLDETSISVKYDDYAVCTLINGMRGFPYTVSIWEEDLKYLITLISKISTTEFYAEEHAEVNEMLAQLVDVYKQLNFNKG